MNNEVRNEFLEKYVSGKDPAQRLQEIISLLDQYSIKEKLKQRITDYKVKAQSLLNDLPINDQQKMN